jgi:hypothetical protein
MSGLIVGLLFIDLLLPGLCVSSLKYMRCICVHDWIEIVEIVSDDDCLDIEVHCIVLRLHELAFD